MANDKLSSMRYKSFIWKFNPSSCSYSCNKAYAEHKYPGIDGVEIEDMGTGAVTISGEGIFFGDNAYSNWVKLQKEFKKSEPGEISHPIFTDVTRGLMVKLSANIEPRANYVSFSFSIISDTAMNDINKPLSKKASGSTGGSTSNSTKIKVGDIVILTGYAYYSSYGNLPRTKYKNGVKYTVTHTNYKGTHPICCGSVGWAKLSDVKLYNGSKSGSSGGDVIYTVKSGDTLSGICSKYGADWKKIASYNHLSNPHLIYPGNKIKIPKSMISK